MTNDQKETVVILATVAVVGVAAYTVGKLTNAVSARLMTRKFDKAVDTQAAQNR